jgi:glutamate racemase
MGENIDPKDRPIGIFDSGVGGLSVFRALEKLLPQESLIYLGDTARIPYGTRSTETVQRYSLEDAQFILSKDVKAIVIACNTASAMAADFLRGKFDLPIMGVIRPGARRAVEATKTGLVGVIATEATVGSGAYQRAILNINRDIKVVAQPCPLFVPLAEEGWIDHPVTEMVANEYLSQIRASSVDALVLGCTHYPLLKPVIERVMGRGVTLIDSGEAVAGEVARQIEERGLGRRSAAPREHRFYVTDSAARFRRVAELFLGRPIDSLEVVELGAA